MNPKKTPRLLFGAGLLYFGLLTSSFAQLNNPVTFQITEIPLPINLTEIKKDEQVTLNFCGLLQSPNRQDILAYCYGNAAKQRTEVEKAWMQLLATNAPNCPGYVISLSILLMEWPAAETSMPWMIAIT